MKNIFIFIGIVFLFFTVGANAQLRPAQSQYMKDKGALVNPSFEQGFKGWTITGCSKSIVSDVPFLNKSLKLTCVASTFSIKQETTSLSTFSNLALNSGCKVKASASGVSIRNLSNGVESKIVSITDLNVHKNISFNDDIDSTSSGLEIAATTYTGDVYIDDCSIAIDEKQIIGNDGDFIVVDKSTPTNHKYSNSLQGKLNPVIDTIPFTPTVSGLGSGSFSELSGRYYIVGETVHVKIYFTKDGTNGTGTSSVFFSFSNIGHAVDTVKLAKGATNTDKLGEASAVLGGVFEPEATIIWGGGTNVGIADSGINQFLRGDDINSASRIQLEFSFPGVGLTSGLDAIVQNKTLTAETSDTFVGVINNSQSGTDFENFVILTCTSGGTGIANCIYTNTSLFSVEKPNVQVTLATGSGTCKYAKVQSDTNLGFTVLTYNNGGTLSNCHVGYNITRTTDFNKDLVIAAAVDSQKWDCGDVKKLILDSTSIGDLTDISFTTMIIGDKYIYRGQWFGNNDSQMHLNDNTTNDVGRIYNGTGGTMIASFSTGCFTATTTSITAHKPSTPTIFGNNSKSETWAQLCHAPANYICN